MTLDVNADAVVMRHAVEDAEERELLTRVAPLAATLVPGRNYFELKDFKDLACFFLEGRARRRAIDDGRFRVMKKVEVVRVSNGTLLTLSELARSTGVPQQSLWRWVSKANLPYRSIGNKKLYNIHEIRQLLLTRCEGTQKGLR